MSQGSHVEQFDACYGTTGDHGNHLEIRSVAELMARWNELADAERERAAHRLGIGKPRTEAVDDVGVAVDASTGKPLFDPGDPTLIDRDCDPELIGKSPEEIIDILEAREERDADSFAFFESLLQREVKVQTHGGGNRGPKKKRAGGASAVDQAAIHSVAGGFAR